MNLDRRYLVWLDNLDGGSVASASIFQNRNKWRLHHPAHLSQYISKLMKLTDTLHHTPQKLHCATSGMPFIPVRFSCVRQSSNKEALSAFDIRCQERLTFFFWVFCDFFLRFLCWRFLTIRFPLWLSTRSTRRILDRLKIIWDLNISALARNKNTNL